MGVMRGTLFAAVTIFAAACSGSGDGDAVAQEQTAETLGQKAALGDGSKTIACAPGGTAAGWKECVVERSRQGGTLFLVVRHPDGAFRRFEVLKDGHGLSVADGADQGKMEISAGTIEIAVGADRYRFPATVKGSVESSGDASDE